MEDKIIKINNNDYITLSGNKETAIKIVKGCGYLYVAKILGNGKTGARHEVAVFSEGKVCLNIPSTEKYVFILSGSYDTEVKYVKIPEEKQEQIAYASVAFQREQIERVEAELKSEQENFVKQQKISDDIYSDTMSYISSVMNLRQNEKAAYKGDDQPLVKVFKLIGQRMDFPVKAAAERIYSASRTGVNMLARDNTIRIREVLLTNGWWNEDNGDLIAFYNPNGNIEIDSYSIDDGTELIPVALIKQSANSPYLIYDPESGMKKKLTKKNASQIYPKAFMAYRSFSESKITVKGLCQFVYSHIKYDMWRYVVIGLICTLIGLVSPYITRNFIDNVIPQAAKNTAIQICIIVFVINISSLLGSLAKYFANMRMETRANSDLEAAVMDRLLKLPVDFFRDYSAGDLSSRILAVNSMQKKIFDIALGCFTNFVFSFVYLIQEFRFCGYFAKWGILFCLVPLLISVITSFASYGWEKMLLERQGKIQGLMLQILNGIDKIHTSNSEKHVFSVWSKEFIGQSLIGRKLLNVQNVTSVVNAIFSSVVSIIFYFLYGYAVQHKKIEGLSTGSFMAFISAYGSFQGAFLGLSGSLLSVRDIIPIYKRIKPLFEQVPEIDDVKPFIGKLKGNIEVSHVDFRYSESSPMVLKDVCIKVEPGEFIAVVGASGAGKSTLLRMLLGFEQPENGTVCYDGIDINAIDIGSLRRQMGVVLQNDTVMAGSILQNIVGSTGKTEEDAWNAARKVAFDKDIEDMPMGMFTMVPAGATTLSGGQKQRLIMARALIKNPDVLIFDEATSALDNVTQNIVRASLDEMKITRVIIAHRLSTIINADRIYVMENGQVVESGTYESLIQSGGYFTKLAKRQNL